MKNISIAGIQPKQGLLYFKIDFTDFIPSKKSDDTIILNIEDSSKIYHSFPKIDRCCKLNAKNVEYDGIDNMKRIDCNLSQKEFTEKYVNKRDAVMMVGCQEEWKAKNWTIENLLDRYSYIKHTKNQIIYFIWTTDYQLTMKSDIVNEKLKSEEVKKLINSGYSFKIFQMLPKGEQGWRHGEKQTKQFMLELFDEYAFPKPMPEDMFQKYHVDTDFSYLMLATAGTGIPSLYTMNII